MRGGDGQLERRVSFQRRVLPATSARFRGETRLAGRLMAEMWRPLAFRTPELADRAARTQRTTSGHDEVS